MLFARPMASLGREWWNNADAGHGLLLAPLAIWLAVRAGATERCGRPALGVAILGFAVVLRFVSELAAEPFVMSVSMILAAIGIVVYFSGLGQVRRWWLSFALMALAVPLPEIVRATVALPLQLQASALGAALLETRNVPVMLAGNVIHIPGQQLFVTEACSGLRSLTALLSLGVLLGGTTLHTLTGRTAIIVAAIPIAIAINGVRVFMTGFLSYFVSPALGRGFMHTTEGWLLFVVAFAFLGVFTVVLVHLERRFRGRRGE